MNQSFRRAGIPYLRTGPRLVGSDGFEPPTLSV
jgi:hypothetical protein